MKSSFHHNLSAKKRSLVLEKKAHLYTLKISRLEKKIDYALHESSLYIAQDSKYQNLLKKALVSFSSVDHVVLVGIGGSSLGTEAVYRALAYKTSPVLTVIDQINIQALTNLSALIKDISNPKKIAVVVVSKSGTTTETMMNAIKVLEVCEKKFGPDFSKRMIFIGDKDTPFLKIAKKRKILALSLPDAIGGRYSLFSAVGMVPLMLLGIDTISLREGARDALLKKEMKHIEEAVVRLAVHAEAGTHTVNFFTFNKQLEYVGQWYRQLLAESIGKRMTTKGTTFAHQLLPVVSTSNDLHSMAQLYLGGYKNMYTHFVHFNEEHALHTLSKHWLLEHVPFLGGKKFTDAQFAISHGVLKAYDDQNLPYRETELEKCTAYSVGFLMTTCMAEVMCLAHVLNVNAFDQPSVELYKVHTRKVLGV